MGCYVLHLRPRAQDLVLDMTTGDKTWKDKYFLAMGFTCVKIFHTFLAAWNNTCQCNNPFGFILTFSSCLCLIHVFCPAAKLGVTNAIAFDTSVSHCMRLIQGSNSSLHCSKSLRRSFFGPLSIQEVMSANDQLLAAKLALPKLNERREEKARREAEGGLNQSVPSIVETEPKAADVSVETLPKKETPTDAAPDAVVKPLEKRRKLENNPLSSVLSAWTKRTAGRKRLVKEGFGKDLILTLPANVSVKTYKKGSVMMADDMYFKVDVEDLNQLKPLEFYESAVAN